MEQNEKPKKKIKKSRFYIYYAVFCAVLVLALSCGIGIFYDFIREYENSLPEHVIEAYIDSLDGDSLSALASPVIGTYTSGFETGDTFKAAMSDAIAEGATFTNTFGEDDHIYDIYCGGKLMSLTLASTSVGKYGFDHYTVTSAEIYPEWIADRLSDVTVIVPEGTSLAVNGKPVDVEYMTDAKYESSSLSVFDRSGTALVTYEITDVFGDIDVFGEYRGEALIITELGEGAYYSDFDLASRFDYEIKAPADAVVTVNGIRVTTDYMTDSEPVDALSTEFEQNLTPTVSVYTLSGLLTAPSVEVKLDGELLSPTASDDSHCDYDYPAGYMKSYTVRVPRGMTLYCNNIEVSRGYVTEENTLYEKPSSASGATVSERYDVYTVGLCHAPSFTVSAEDAAVTSEGSDFTFYPLPTSSQVTAVTRAAETFTELFIKYNFVGGSNIDANYAACMEYVLSKSDASSIISGTYNAVLYNDTYTIKKLETHVYDIARYSDNCVTLKIKFESYGTRYKYEKENNGTYLMVWVLSGGSWKLAGFST